MDTKELKETYYKLEDKILELEELIEDMKDEAVVPSTIESKKQEMNKLIGEQAQIANKLSELGVDLKSELDDEPEDDRDNEEALNFDLYKQGTDLEDEKEREIE